MKLTLLHCSKCSVFLAVLSVSGSVLAHHSTRAFYDRDATIEIAGTVTAVFWRNRHVGLTLVVENEQREQEEWQLEGGAMNSLLRRGFTPDSVEIGDQVRVAGAPSLRGENAIYVTNLLLPGNGEVLFTDVNTPLRWTESVASASAVEGSVSESPATGIFRVWSFGGTLYELRDPLSLTPVAQAAKDAWNPQTDDPGLRCQAPGMPNAILNPYPIEFIDADDTMQLRIEEWDATRVIHKTADVSLQDQTPSPLGYSVGRWEGATLVVETTRIDWLYLDDGGTPQSPDVEIVERFTLSGNETRLDYEITVMDRQNLVEPAIWDAFWVWEPGAAIKPYECTLR